MIKNSRRAPLLAAAALAVLALALSACDGKQAANEPRLTVSPIPAGNVRVGAFNLQNYGPTKAANTATVDAIARVAVEYDGLVLQEIEDVSGSAQQRLLDAVNRISPQPYRLELSARLGRSASTEQYGFLYRPDRLSLISSIQIDDPEDEFEREPTALTISHGGYTYGLIALHAKPDDAVKEINQVAFVYDAYRNLSGNESAFVIGDLNADCDYATDAQLRATALCSDPRFSWLIPDGADTTTGASNCAYDRIVARGPVARHLNQPAVYRFDQHLGIAGTSVSDHYPVEVEVGDAGGDYSGFSCAPGATEAPSLQRTSGRFAFDIDGAVPVEPVQSPSCCRTCTTGKACGDSCISRANNCSIGSGCACDG